MNKRNFLLGVLFVAGAASLATGLATTSVNALPLVAPLSATAQSELTPNVAIATPEDVSGAKVEDARWHRHYRRYHYRHHHRRFYHHHRRHRFYY